MAFTPFDFTAYADEVANIYSTINDELIIQIAKRLKTDYPVIKDNIAQWQISMLSQSHGLTDESIKRLSKLSGVSESKINDIITKAGYEVIKDIDQELENILNRTLADPSFLDATLQSYVNQTFLDIQNFVNQTLITTNYGANAITRMYEQIINEITAKVLSGIKTFDKAVTETIIKWADKGISSSFIDKGGNTWSIDRYVRTVLKSTIGRTYNDLRTSRMSEFGIYTVLVSSKAEARPDCARCQGKILDIRPVGENISGYPSVYEFGYGRPGGHRGINCMHMHFVWMEGMANNQPQYSTESAIERYNLTQKQRSMENKIKNTKRNIKIAENLGNEEETKRYKQILRNQQSNIREFVKENDLPRFYSNEKVYL